MISSLWFLIKAVIFILALGWLFSLGGTVDINAFGYDIAAPFGVFAVALILVFYAVAYLGRMIMAIIQAPSTLSKGYQKYTDKLGMQSLTYGLSAVAAGDQKSASYHSKRANRFLKDDYGLVALLSGLSARLNGDEKLARESFKNLLKREETSFLGVRGLLQTALDHNDYRSALKLTREAYERNPRQSWIIKTLYRLELKHRNMTQALTILKQGAKRNVFPLQQVNHDRAAMAMIEGDFQTAYKQAPDFLPAGLAMIKHYIANGKTRKAKKAVETLWTDNPHPALLDHWIGLAPRKTQENPMRLLSWVEDLQRKNMNSAACNLYVAEIAMRYDYTTQARRFLEMALDIKPTMHTYQLMARLEPMAGWADLIPSAAQDKCWICKTTGRIFNDWQAFNDENDFNTIIWAYPDEARENAVRVFEKSPTPFFLTDDRKSA